MRIPRRSLRRYEHQRVIVTLDNDSGVRGFLERVYLDHLLLFDAQGMVAAADGSFELEAKTGSSDVVPLARVVRIRLASGE